MYLKLIFLSSLIFLLANCTPEITEDPEEMEEIPIATDFPECIDSSFFDNENHAIKAQYFDDAFHYWLDTPASSWDGTEYIVSENCDTLCSFNGLFYTDCWLAYDSEGWVTLWPE
jgi:hypothetical protein